MDKLAALRALMKEDKIDAYIVTGGDAHGSSWVSGHWGGRKWLTGFTGSAGLAVVTQTEAGLWTDGRYFVQAERELEGTGFDLYKMGQPDVPTYEEFLLQKFPEGACIGFDGQTMTFASYDKLHKKLNPDYEKENENSVRKFSFNNDDLIGNIWLDRPPIPNAPAFEHLPQFAGLSAAEKLRVVREKMREYNLTSYLVTALDSIAWLLNMRGQDFGFPGMPVAYAFALITEKEAFVFINPEKVADISGKLISQGFSVENYHAVADKLNSLQPGGKIYLNPNTTNVSLYYAIPAEVKHDHEHADIIIDLKGVKSETELANIRNAFVKEGAAMTKLLKWIYDSMANGKTITEDDVAETLIGLRKQQEHYIGDSFPVIAAYGVHGVQPHYRHTGSGAVLQNQNFFLLDTGGQYLDGTTDTTRTIALCEPTSDMKRDFTLVL
jgi:Xaa-Pro aminopeptidase